MQPHTYENPSISTATGEQSPQSLNERLEGALSFDAIQSIRAQQSAIYQRARYTVNGHLDTSPESIAAAEKNVNDVVTSYLKGNVGEDETDPLYQRTRTLLDTYSFINTPEDTWYADTYDSDGNKVADSGLDRYLKESSELLATTRGGDVAAAEAEALELTKNTEAQRAKLGEYRESLATLSAKRQGRIFGNGGEKYAEAHKHYNDQMIELGKIENADVINDESLSLEEKQVKVIEYIFNEQKKLRELTTEKLKGTKVGKFVEWMNRGRIGTRILKGALLGAGVGVAAAGIGALAGVAGTAALGAGVAAVGTGAWRFARGFAKRDALSGRGMDANADITADSFHDIHRVGKADADLEALGIESAPEVPVETDLFASINSVFSDQFEKDTKLEQSKRRKSVAWGLGGIALGIGLAEVGHIAFDLYNPGLHIDGHDPIFGHHGNTPTTPHNNVATTPPTHVSIDADHNGSATEIVTPTIHHDPDFNIARGEGGIQLFHHLGLKTSDWYDVQEKLLHKFPHDFYDPDGKGPIAVRIAHPGHLSIAAQEYIKAHFNLK